MVLKMRISARSALPALFALLAAAPCRAEVFASDIDSIARRHGIDSLLVRAVIRAESNFDPKAVSPKGAVGLMQLMPETALRYGVENRFDPAQNVDGGVRYLRDLIAMFQGDLTLALAAYNAGEAAVMKYGRRVPPYPESQQYIVRVKSYHEQLLRK